MTVATPANLCLTPDRLARMRAAGTANAPEWVRLKNCADSFTTADPNYANEKLPALALVYQLTGDTSYADKCIGQLMGIVGDAATLGWWQADQQFWTRTLFPFMGKAYGWTRDRMTAAQRTAISGYLMDRAYALWPEFNGGHTPWAGEDPANNYMAGFMTSWLPALACYHDDPNRAPALLDMLKGRWVKQVVPYLNDWGQGGLNPESNNYDSTQRQGMVVDAHLSMTGEDLSLDTKFFDQSILWRIHSLVPSRMYRVPEGEQPAGAIADEDRMRMLVAVNLTKNDQLRAWGYFWLDNLVGWPAIRNDGNLDFALLYADPTAPRTDYRTDPAFVEASK